MRGRSAPGAITVYCAMVFLLLAGLIGVMLERAHQSAVRVNAGLSIRSALGSLFSEYDADLYGEYGLLFYNEELSGGYEEAKLAAYMAAASLSPSGADLLRYHDPYVWVNDRYYAVDDHGIFFEREVVELMKVLEVTSLANELTHFSTLLDNANSAKDYLDDADSEYENTDWKEVFAEEESLEAEESSSQESTLETYPADTSTSAEEESLPESSGTGEESTGPGDTQQESTENASGESTTEEETTSEPDKAQKVEDEVNKSIIAQVKELLTDVGLTFYLGDTEGISGTDKEPTLSPGENHGIGMGGGDTLLNSVLFGEYILRYLSYYTVDKHASGMQYEVEYVLWGHDSDKANLLATVAAISGVRTAFNSVTILANPQLYEQAKEKAVAMVGWTGNALIIKLIELMLVAAWAYCESILDVRALCKGEKLPIVKSADEWTTTLGECVSKVLSGEAAESGDRGIDYKAYLRILLFLENREDKIMRTMQAIEWDMKRRDVVFSFGSCIYAMEVTARIKVEPVFSALTGLFVNDNELDNRIKIRWSHTY